MIASFFKSSIKTITPEHLHKKLSYVYNLIKYFGFSRKCPVCSSYLRMFLPHGVIERNDSVCPVCRVKEHHRLAWLYFNKINLFKQKLTILHLAPEPIIRKKLQQIPTLKYFSGDLYHNSDIRLDACMLPIKDASIDFIYCSHVLNMMPYGQDIMAMKEFNRVISSDGWALIQVPIFGEKTIECMPPCTRDKRIEMFEDPDMYRRYGKDFTQRLSHSGLDIEENHFYVTLSEQTRIRYGIKREAFYVCRK